MARASGVRWAVYAARAPARRSACEGVVVIGESERLTEEGLSL